MIAALLIALVRVYQKTLSRLLPGMCRFHPSCSRYAVGCLENHGALRGSLLSFVRVCKCQPFHPGGVDLPPPPGTPLRAALFPSAARELRQKTEST